MRKRKRPTAGEHPPSSTEPAGSKSAREATRAANRVHVARSAFDALWDPCRAQREAAEAEGAERRRIASVVRAVAVELGAEAWGSSAEWVLVCPVCGGAVAIS